MSETNPRYESTISPPARDFSTPGRSSTLGQRQEEGLRRAFIGGVGTTDTDQKDALGNARLVMLGQVKLDFTGPDKNPLFPQYRRDFKPAGEGLTDEYKDPRDKNSVEVRDGTGLGTPYTPTIASPGEENGISPTNLRSVPSQATQILKDGPVDLIDNPANDSHRNRTADGVLSAGKVRLFKLGVASSPTTVEPIPSRGQFRQP